MEEFDRIIGYSAVKEELERIADSLKNAEHYRAFGASSPRGLILYGPPGTGKTTMAHCLIKATGRPTFTCRRTEGDEAFIDKMNAVFAEAEANAPSIVFLDDMDKFANSDGMHRDATEFVAVQGCIDDLRGKEVFVLATANENIKNLPSSLLRPGRFDRRIAVGAPKGEDAVEIIESYLADKPRAGELDPKVIAAMLAGHSCATLETVVNEAAIIAVYERSESITARHMIEASMRAVYHVPSECLYDTERVDLASASAKSIVVWHEAGHAVMNELLMPESVALVSAKSKRRSHSGFTVTSWRPPENPYRAEISEVMVLLGGKAAVDVVFGMPDTGADDDIKKAAERLTCLIGPSSTHGFMLHRHDYDTYEDDEHYRDTGQMQFARQCAAGVLLEDYYNKTKRALIENRSFLTRIAESLAEKSYLTATEINALKQGLTLTPPEL